MSCHWLAFCTLAVALELPALAATYHVSPDGDDSNPGTLGSPWRTIGKAAEALRPGDTVLIRAGTYRERLVPLTSGTVDAEITYRTYPGETATIDGTGVDIPEWGALLDLSGRSHLRISGLAVLNARMNPHNPGILADECDHVTIEGTRVWGTNDSGIAAWNSSFVTISQNEVDQFCLAGWNEGITVGNTTDFEVRENLVHHGPKEGICLKDGSARGRAIGNEVHHTEAVGIYVDASARYTHDIEINANSSHDGTEGGISIASEVGGLLENVTVVNNISFRNGWSGIEVSRCCIDSHPIQGVLIANNTVFDNGRAGWGGGVFVENRQAQGVVIRNNITSGNLTFQIVIPAGLSAGQVVVDHNLIDGFRGDAEEIRGEAAVEGDPLFVSTAGGNFHLRADSPAIDRGTAIAAPLVDFDRVARPQGSGIDIGAFERPGGATGCQPSATELCLNEWRFRATATFRDYAGNGGDAHAVPMTNDTGYFWFSDRDNVEVVVKVLDFCSVNGSWSVYAAGLTDLDVVLTVTDTASGLSKRYRNQLGAPFVLVREAAFSCP